MASEATTLLGLEPSQHPEGCDGRGWIDIEGERYVRRCEGCERDKGLAAIVRFVPPRFRAPIELPNAITEWTKHGHQAEGLYLCGGIGSGKTHLAYAAAAAWCVTEQVMPRSGGTSEEWLGGRHYGPNVALVRATQLFDELRPNGENVRQRVADLQRAALLVVDDLGAEKPSEWTQERVYELLDQRYVECSPLIVTSNLPPRALAEHVGERVASRLSEWCQVVPIVGSDRRRSNPERKSA